MKKKSGNKDLDNELNFDDLEDLEADGMDFGGIDDADLGSRKPSTREVASELAKEAGTGFLDSVARKTAEKALPESYKDNYYAAVDYADFTKETFQASKSKINKSLYNLGKEVKKILPFQSKMLEGFLEKYESDFDTFKAQTEEQIREGNIQSNLSSIFDKQLEVTKAIEAKRGAEAQADKKQQLAISKVNLDVLTSIDNNLSNQTAFTLQISKEYYRKSLELQYKSYFVQADMLKDMRDYFKGFSKQFEDIQLNTSLPDFVKLHKSEAAKQIIRDQTMQSVYKQLFTNSDYIQNIKKRMTNLINEKVSGITDAIDNITEAASGINQASEMGGGAGQILGGIAAGMGGGILGEKAGNTLGAKIQDKIKGNKYINAGGNYLATLANSPKTFFSMLRNKTSNAKQDYSDEGTPLRYLASKLLGGADELLSVTDPSMEKHEVKKASILDHNKPAIFDNKVHRSITEVIPMYLAKILSANKNLGGMYKAVNWQHLYDHQDEEDQVYDYVNRKLSTKEEFKAAVEKSVFKDSAKESKKISNAASSINSLALSSVDKKADKDTYKALSNKKGQKSFEEFMSIASTKLGDDDFTYDTLVTNLDKSPDLKSLMERNPSLKSYIQALQTLNLSSKNQNLNEKIKDVKRLYPITGLTEMFKRVSVLANSKTINSLKPDVANIISKGLASYMDKTRKPVTLESILNGNCFLFLSNTDLETAKVPIQIFINHCRRIQAEDLIDKNAELINLIGMVNESIYRMYEFDPEVFKTLNAYSDDLQGDGELTLMNLAEGKLGKDDRPTDFVDPGVVKMMTKVKDKEINKLLQAKSKASIIDVIQSSAFGKDVEKYSNILKKFSGDMESAEGVGGMASAIKSMVTDMAKQTQESAVSLYKKANEELNTYYGQLDSYLKDQSEAGAIKAKDAMLKAANSYISKVDELIRKEEEALSIDQAKMDEIDSSLQNEVSDSKIQNAIAKAKKVMKRSKADEIKLLKDFRVKLIKSRDRITSIKVGQGVSISEFGTAAKAAFDAFMKEAKDTLAEFEAKAEAEAAAIV